MARRTMDQLRGYDRAASSMIGLKILVGVTVLISFVVGAYALHLGGVLERPTPSANFAVTTDTADDVVNVTHTGGDSVVAADVQIVVSNGSTSLVFVSSDTTVLAAGDSFAIDTNTLTVSGRSGAAFVQETEGETNQGTPSSDDDDDDEDETDGT